MTTIYRIISERRDVLTLALFTCRININMTSILRRCRPIKETDIEEKSSDLLLEKSYCAKQYSAWADPRFHKGKFQKKFNDIRYPNVNAQWKGVNA